MQSRERVFEGLALPSQAESLRLQLRSSEELCASLEGLRADLEAARAACRSAEETAERRGVEIRKMQQSAQSAESLRKYQDICLVRGGRQG